MPPTTSRPPSSKVVRADVPDVPRIFRPLPPNASLEQAILAYNEMASAYATIASGLTSEVPAVQEDMKEVRAELIVVGATARRAEGGLNALLNRVDALEGLRIAAPPMRPPSKSISDIAAHVAQVSVKEIRAYETSPSTPPGPPDDDAQEAIIAQRVATAMAIKENERLKQAEEDRRNAAIADAVTNRQIRILKWSTGLSILAGIVATLVAHFAR